MRFHLATAAVMATATTAFLLPPNSDTAAELSVLEQALAEQRGIVVHCNDCPVHVEDLTGEIHTLDKPSKLFFSLAVDHGQKDTLLVNGVQFWPLSFDADSLAQPLVVPQLVEMAPNKWQEIGEPLVKYRLAYDIVSRRSVLPMDVVTISVQVVEVAGKPIGNMQIIKITILTDDTDLFISEVASEVEDAPLTTPTAKPECKDTMCKIQAAFKHHMGNFKGCGGGKTHGQGRLHPQHGPHHDHRRHRHHFMRVLKGLAIQVLIPISVGIIAGVASSMLGMVVGYLIVAVYRLFFRRGPRNGSEDHATSEEDGLDKVLVVYPDGPPSYEFLDTDVKQHLLVDEKYVESVEASHDAE